MSKQVKVTSAKRVANRANETKSTGSRTAAGKAVSRLNGLRHGLRADLVVVTHLEKASEWDGHRAGVLDSLAPMNYLEALLADRVALATWRLRRATRYERATGANGRDRTNDHCDRATARHPRTPPATRRGWCGVRRRSPQAHYADSFGQTPGRAPQAGQPAFRSQKGLCVWGIPRKVY